eukprot:gnl/MRDRNA2_/MRDRNA2_83951_c0_seq1.p1 gnl/MRDRNA2_/MRDRNA2_83951_c0~~gnl/MRDRNA2_/MRDRNA2_83951_c0_seq1.p1  ORF type:complete len:175 (+),score=17.62 gnl/MRDRNA2_/MRDRNA2_83951_c0_seq1:71-526(+)
MASILFQDASGTRILPGKMHGRWWICAVIVIAASFAFAESLCSIRDCCGMLTYCGKADFAMGSGLQFCLFQLLATRQLPRLISDLYHLYTRNKSRHHWKTRSFDQEDPSANLVMCGFVDTIKWNNEDAPKILVSMTVVNLLVSLLRFPRVF